jgi:hypothetical protein
MVLKLEAYDLDDNFLINELEEMFYDWKRSKVPKEYKNCYYEAVKNGLIKNKKFNKEEMKYRLNSILGSVVV